MILLDRKIVIYVSNVKKCDRIWLKHLLSSVANSISEINKKEWKAYMKRKNIKSECDFMGINDNQLSYKCKKCKKKKKNG